MGSYRVKGEGEGTEGNRLLFSKLIFCTRRPFRVSVHVDYITLLRRCTAFLPSFFFFLLLLLRLLFLPRAVATSVSA